MGLAAQAHDLEQLQDRIVLSPGEDLTQREPLGRNALEFEHPSKLAVAVAEDELVVTKLEQPDPDRQRLEDVRQQLDRLAVGIRAALRGWRRWP